MSRFEIRGSRWSAGSRTALLRSALAVAVALLPATATAASFERSTGAGPEGVVRIELDRGSVSVVAHDEPELYVAARATGLGASGFAFSLNEQEDHWSFRGRRASWLEHLGDTARVEVRIRAPRGWSVEIETPGPVTVSGIGGVTVRSAGPIRVRDVSGSVEARTAKAGDMPAPIDVRTAAGDVHAFTDGSRIRLSHVEGDVEAQAAGGEIEIDGVSGAVVAETTDASILARFEHAPAGEFRNHGGWIDIAFPAEEGVELDARSAGGCVFVDRDARSGCGVAAVPVVEPINGGGPTLQLRAVEGDIRLSAL